MGQITPLSLLWWFWFWAYSAAPPLLRHISKACQAVPNLINPILENTFFLGMGISSDSCSNFFNNAFPPLQLDRATCDSWKVGEKSLTGPLGISRVCCSKFCNNASMRCSRSFGSFGAQEGLCTWTGQLVIAERWERKALPVHWDF